VFLVGRISYSFITSQPQSKTDAAAVDIAIECYFNFFTPVRAKVKCDLNVGSVLAAKAFTSAWVLASKKEILLPSKISPRNIFFRMHTADCSV
jgi:hypothetical protein